MSSACFELAGEKSEQAKADAATIMKLETDLAKGSLDLVSRRDPEKVYHKMNKPELASLSPAFRWNLYFTGSGAPEFSEHQRGLAGFLQGRRGRDSKAPVCRSGRPISPGTCCTPKRRCLPAAFVEENFDFYGKTLTGAKEMRPALEALRGFSPTPSWAKPSAASSVERTFGAEGKERTLKMVDALEKALARTSRRYRG